jgi:glycosyltransferase involved in cell wall biosynthesis
MRIAFLGPSFPWRGGIAQFAQNMAGKLLQNGHDVMMFTFIHQYPELLFPGSNQIDNSQLVLKLATHRVLTPYNPVTWISAISDIKGWNPDVVIVQYWLPFMAPAFGFVLKCLKGVKRLFVIHNVEAHEKWMFNKTLTKYAFRQADLFLTLSDISTNSLMQLDIGVSTANVKQLFHPVYEFSPVNKEKSLNPKNRILFFGFVKHYKGLDILLEAMPAILNEMPEIKLVIAGDVYGDKKIYLEMISRLHIRDNVETHFRYIPDEEISDFFTGCDVCVIPYRTATQSGVAQMAFSYEVPVIATRVGGLEEMVKNGENGYLVAPNNPQVLAETVLSFYRHKQITVFQENIRKQNEQFSWDSFTRSLIGFLK